MPFDGTITAPSLTLLSEILRGGPEHPMWPEGFVWDYTHCHSCAIGLVERLWLSGKELAMSSVFSIKSADADRIFFDLSNELNVPFMKDITPTHVADAIDEHLATRSDAPVYESVTGA